MAGDDAALWRLLKAIAASDAPAVVDMLAASPGLATTAVETGATRAAASDHFLTEIGHYVYGGDTALHIAAAAYRPKIVALLTAGGADVAATNRRGATPLHYAADGMPGSANWNPHDQAETIALLIAAGADPNAVDRSGVAPLHRAVRTRCAAAVGALLEGGSNLERRNRNGSTPMLLATQTTGRGASGSAEAKAQQAQIIWLLERALGAPGTPPGR